MYDDRVNELDKFHNLYDDILSAAAGYPDVNFRYVVAPNTPLQSGGFVPINSTVEEME